MAIEFKVGDKIKVKACVEDVRFVQCTEDCTPNTIYAINYTAIRKDTKFPNEQRVSFVDDIGDSVTVPARYVTLATGE